MIKTFGMMPVKVSQTVGFLFIFHEINTEKMNEID